MGTIVTLAHHTHSSAYELKQLELKKKILERLEHCFRAFRTEFKFFAADQVRGKKLRLYYRYGYPSGQEVRTDVEVRAITIDGCGLRFCTIATYEDGERRPYLLQWDMDTDEWAWIDNHETGFRVPCLVTPPLASTNQQVA